MALTSLISCRIPRALPFVLSACRFRTQVEDPALHSENDDAKFYAINDNDYDRYLRMFFRREQNRLMETLGDRALMVRPPSREVISILKDVDYSLPATRFVLYGNRGVGISCQLAHVAHWCGRNNWLLVHAYNFQELLHYSPQIEQSSFNPEFWDSPKEAVDWLKRFTTTNSQWLEEHQPMTTKDVVWNLKESCSAGSSWQEVIQFGISRPKYATDALAVILREIREQATASLGNAKKNVRVLVCIDGVNALWSTNSRLYDGRNHILPDRISMFEAFRRLLHADWCNGAIVTSVSQKYAWKDARESFTPRYLLGRQGFELMEPFIPILVENFTMREAKNYLNYYEDLGWITNPYIRSKRRKRRVHFSRREAVEQMIYLSDFNPHELSVLCGEW